MKQEKKLFATIGHEESYLDRREQLLEAKKRRDELRRANESQNLFAKYFAPNQW